MMEVITLSIIPLKLNHLDAPNWAIGLIITNHSGKDQPCLYWWTCIAVPPLGPFIIEWDR